MNRLATFVVALGLLVTACGDNSAQSDGPTPDAPCLDDLTARVDALRASVDALELSEPDGAHGAKGTTYETLAADLDDLEADLDTVESSLDATETQVTGLSPRTGELLNAMSMLAVDAH